jgi:hypothetical protein
MEEREAGLPSSRATFGRPFSLAIRRGRSLGSRSILDARHRSSLGRLVSEEIIEILLLLLVRLSALGGFGRK